ncbi:MAG: hypothetical protein C4534_08195 [Gaiellales bacterium]|nr:MAG: hypothetical protein C4534_08195 [Gaiellales bacterium]
MVDLTQFLSVGGMAALITVLLEIVKSVGQIDTEGKRWLSLIALALGVALMPLVAWVLGQLSTPADLVSALISGVLAGAAAIGLYEVPNNIGKLTGPN